MMVKLCVVKVVFAGPKGFVVGGRVATVVVVVVGIATKQLVWWETAEPQGL